MMTMMTMFTLSDCRLTCSASPLKNTIASMLSGDRVAFCGCKIMFPLLRLHCVSSDGGYMAGRYVQVAGVSDF